MTLLRYTAQDLERRRGSVEQMAKLLDSTTIIHPAA
jgi:hypothetical protein